MGSKILTTAFALCLASIGAVWAAESVPQAGDAAAGKTFAAAHCAACHGISGISPKAGIPHIAGQHASYIRGALAAYSTGARKEDPPMHQATAKLNKKSIADVAAYYASLMGFNSRPKEPQAASAANSDQDPFAAVRKLTSTCAGCHGKDGNSETPGTPSLAGQHDAYLVTAIEAYHSGTRTAPMMQALVKPLTRSQIEDIAYFYAAMIPRRAKVSSEGDAIAGLAVTAPCAGCHGVDGNGTDLMNPRLAGQNAGYLIAAVNAYKDGRRKNNVMRDQVLALRDQDVKNLAAYYASQEPRPLPIRKPLTVTEWTARCNRCHGPNGNSTDPRFPILAGQNKAYLAKALVLYHGGKRKNKLMNAMSFLMAESDIDKLSAFYSAQRKQ